MSNFLKKHGKWLLLTFLCATVLMVPFFFETYREGHDTLYHVANISSIVKSMKANFFNLFTAKIMPDIANNLGYGTRLFYPPISHILASLITYILDLFNINILTSLKVFHYLILLLSAYSMYYCSYQINKDERLSFFSSLIYISCSYRLSEIYVRDALAESTVFIFLPFIIVSISELFKGNDKKFTNLFVIGYVGGILSHFTLMIYFTLLLGISLLIMYKKVLKKEFIYPFIKATVIVLLLTLFFFEPLFEHKLFGEYRVYQKWVMSQGIWHTALWGYEYILPVESGCVFYFVPIIILILLFKLKNEGKELKKESYKLIILFTILSLWMSTRYFPWLIMPYSLFMIQFGWRIVTFTILGVSFLVPISLKNIKNKYLNLLIILLVLIQSLIFLKTDNYQVVNLDNDYIVKGMGEQKEYLPVKLYNNLDYFNNRNQDIISSDSNANINVIKNDIQDIEFEIISDTEVEIEFPRIFYYGYTLRNQDNKLIDVYENDKGLLSSKISSGTYSLKYTGSTPYKISCFISLFTFLICLIYLIRKS